MRKKQGFTLIELLAVIVILAIIALIATPMILNVVESARRSAATSSALGWIDAVEKQIMINEMDDEKTNIPNGTLTVSALSTTYGVTIKGQMPEGTGTVTIQNSKITSASLKVGKYDISCTANTCTIEGTSGSSSSTATEVASGPTMVAAGVNDTHKGTVYLDPTDLTATCTALNSVNTTGTKTGCMKWNIYDDSGDTYKLILGHKTTDLIAYETSGEWKEYSQASIKSQVDLDTAGWVGNPRLITVSELENIATPHVYPEYTIHWFGTAEYPWIYDGDDNYSFWYSTPDDGDHGTCVYGQCLETIPFENSDACGIRPVIEISKTLLAS